MASSESAWPNGGIAIVGGGIAGLTLAISLLQRNVPCTIYEQAPKFGEIGAGVAFSPNAVRAMLKCDKGVFGAFKKAATHNSWGSKRAEHDMKVYKGQNGKEKVERSVQRKGTYFDFLDGYSQGKETSKDEEGVTRIGGEKLLFTLYNNEGANSVHRAHFLDELVKLVPKETSQFGKHLKRISGESEPTGPVTLHFSDGTTAKADAVVGTDGIKSRVRQMILGADTPASRANYSHKYAYRGLIPMDEAIAALGEDCAVNAKMHLGPNHHVLTFPINNGKIMNVVAFATNPDPWPDHKKLTLPTTKGAALHDFSGWGSNVLKILNMLKDDLDCWAIFDMLDHPASTYTKGRLVITGDAAHATSPHHGSGAGFAIEDSAVMAELLASPDAHTPAGLRAAFRVFDECRRPRTQWLVESSRRTGDLFEWRAEGVGSDVEKIHEELSWRHERIWNGDIDAMCEEARERLRTEIGKV